MLAIGLVYWLSGVAGPVLLMVITAILSMIPFGAPVGFGLAALVLVFQGKGLAALVVLAWGLVVTFVASHFMQPALIGGSLRQPFLAIFLSMFGGLATLGLSGLFVGPTVAILALDLWHRALRDTATSTLAISSPARQPGTVGATARGADQHSPGVNAAIFSASTAGPATGPCCKWLLFFGKLLLSNRIHK